MITTELNRAEFTAASSATDYVFATGGTNIPVKNETHIKVYITNTGAFTANASTNVFTDTSHGHLDTEVIRVSAATALPLGLLANTDYYVRDKTTNTFKLATSSGGTAVAITTAGTGTLTWTKTLLKTLTTDYTVTFSGTTATVKFNSAPPDGVGILLLREVPFEQNTDLQNNSQLEAESLESQLDLIVNQTQQLKNKIGRQLTLSDTLIASDATATAVTLNVTSTNRQNKSLKFDGSGNLTVSSIDVDKAEDYILESKSYATESGAVVNTYDGGVASTTSDYSSKEWATGSTTTSAKDYAIKTSAAVTGSEFSAKEYAQGTQSGTGGSSKNWASQVGADVTGGSSGDKSAKSWAQETSGTAPSAGSAKEWATKTDAAVDTTFSAKEYAQGTQASTGGSAKSWAQDTNQVDGAGTDDRSAKAWSQGASMTGATLGGSSKDWAQLPVSTGTVDGPLYSSKAYSQSTTAGTDTYGGSAKGWASTAYDTAVPGAGSSDRSALHYATDASNSAISAKNSANAVANTFDKFDDVYLGTMSDSSTQGTNPTTNGTWAKDSSAITVASGSNIKVGQVVTGTGMPSPPPNVISVSGTAVVVSENMAAAGSAVALTFTGYGVYGTYNGTKDGPTTDNDNGALADGMLYFNSTDNNMMVYKTTGATWIAATSSGGVSLVMHKAVASGSETSFAAGTFTPTLTYEVNNIVVFLNGVRLDATDYTATTGTSITGLSALTASDELVVLAFKTFEVADAVSAASGGTFSGDVTYNGNIIMATTKKIEQRGAFMQSSTHQSLVLGG